MHIHYITYLLNLKIFKSFDVFVGHTVLINAHFAHCKSYRECKCLHNVTNIFIESCASFGNYTNNVTLLIASHSQILVRGDVKIQLSFRKHLIDYKDQSNS